jgi:hypothetical protein
MEAFKVAAAVAVLLITALCALLWQQLDTGKRDASTIAELRSALASKSNQENGQAARDCATQSGKVYAAMKAEWSRVTPGIRLISLDYQNHYNAKLAKCFMTTNEMTQNGMPPYSLITTKLLFDAYENRTYGNFIWMASDTKKYWEQPPEKCSVTPKTGIEKTCKSTEEYDALVAQYME